MNNLDKQYLELCQEILDKGTVKATRNGQTRSVFSRQIRHKMSEGFPLITTKKVPFKSVVTELIWFLRGDTNIKYLIDNNCNIWAGDAYKNYCNVYPDVEKTFQYENNNIEVRKLTQSEFIERIKTDNEFAVKWGNLGPIYGKQWRNLGGYNTGYTTPARYGLDFSVIKPEEHFDYVVKGIDQTANLINNLKTNPDDRALIVSAWNVGELDKMVLRPCHNFFQCYTRELSVKERLLFVNGDVDEYEKKEEIESIGLDFDLLLTSRMNELNVPKRALSLMWNQRSVDVPLGLPFNIASYATLLELFAKECNMVADELIGNLGDCHIYENQIEGIKEQLTRQPIDMLSTLDLSCVEFPLLKNIDNGSIAPTDFLLKNYQCHPAIKMPLSN